MKTIAQKLNITKFPFIIKDKKGDVIYFENVNRYWSIMEYDEKKDVTYFENSDGLILDDRTKPTVELTMDEIADKFGIDVNLLKIKK